MAVLHVSKNSNGIELVTLVANAVDKQNNLYVIKRKGVIYYSGGFIFKNTKKVREIFASVPKEDHYRLATILKIDPVAKPYYDTKRVKE